MRASVGQPASLSLLDGDLLEDLDGIDPNFDAWLNTERERLRDRARGIAEAMLKEDLEPEAVIAAAQRLLTIDRTHEGGWRALMRAHATRGERGLAVQAYDRCRATLADMLDAAPSAETQKLLNEIRGPSGSRLPLRPPAPLPPAETEPEPAPAARRSGAAPAPRGGAHIGVLPLRLVGMPPRTLIWPWVWRTKSRRRCHASAGCSSFPSNSVARFAEDQRDEAAIRRELDLDFLLDGTIQRAGNKIRVSLRLLDLRAANQIVWARRFDREADDLLSLQDEIAAEVVAQIDPEILLIEAKRSTARAHVDATAYDLMLRALPLMGRMEHAVHAGRTISGRGHHAGTRLCRRACVVRILACVPGGPGLGGSPKCHDGKGRRTGGASDQA